MTQKYKLTTAYEYDRLSDGRPKLNIGDVVYYVTTINTVLGKQYVVKDALGVAYNISPSHLEPYNI